MENYETHNETLVREILEKGMNKSADSLGTMINSSIGVKGMQIKMADDHVIDMIFGVEEEERKDDVLILKTELVGPIGGINYVLLSQSDVKSICDQVLTAELADEDSAQMTLEFLKEIENVLAAATITEIADQFKVDMFGDVPKIQAVGFGDIDSVVGAEISALLPKLQLRCNFSIESLGISPKVVWVFDDAFMQRVTKEKEGAHKHVS